MPDRIPKALPPSRNFLGLERARSSYKGSSIVIVSAPYERTVSYGGGAAEGPAGILAASHYVEFWDEEFGRELCHDHGICALSPLSFDGLDAEQALELIHRQVARILEDGKYAVTLGGEHTVSTAPARAHLAKYPGLGVLQFDAHSDLRDSYSGTPWSHASVMARICEFLNPERLVQVGIRAQCIEESRMIEARRIRTFYAHEFRDMKNRQQAVIDALPQEVYITFDVDFLDPSIMPATGTPEPGGCLWDETIALIKAIAAERRIVGFDLVELAPMKWLPAPTYLAAKLVYKILNAAFSGR